MRDGAIEARTHMHSVHTHAHCAMQITRTFWTSLSRATSTSSGTLGQLLVILCLTAAHGQRVRVHQATHAAWCVQTHVLCMYAFACASCALPACSRCAIPSLPQSSARNAAGILIDTHKLPEGVTVKWEPPMAVGATQTKQDCE
jgi:hypothetical protein